VRETLGAGIEAVCGTLYIKPPNPSFALNRQILRDDIIKDAFQRMKYLPIRFGCQGDRDDASLYWHSCISASHTDPSLRIVLRAAWATRNQGTDCEVVKDCQDSLVAHLRSRYLSLIGLEPEAEEEQHTDCWARLHDKYPQLGPAMAVTTASGTAMTYMDIRDRRGPGGASLDQILALAKAEAERAMRTMLEDCRSKAHVVSLSSSAGQCAV
jgi:hypothetical protein